MLKDSLALRPGWHELTWEHVESYQWTVPTDVDRLIDTSEDPEPLVLIDQIVEVH